MCWTAVGQDPQPEHPHIELVPSWISEIYGSKQGSASLAAKLVTEGSSGIAAVVLPQDTELWTDERKWQLEQFYLDRRDQVLNLSLSYVGHRLDIRVDGQEVIWNMKEQ
ncbi:hypothetical protein D3C85_1569610 [compost metagenome]